MSWASELPGELLLRPTGLVVLTGLDTTYNAVHKAIWDSFCNNRRPDRVPLQFIVQSADHEYPKCRSKRTSYEWYIPKGILKTQWMKKHLEQIPGVIVAFFDIDWDETLWKEKQMECATKVQIIRDSLAERGTRVCVVLVQKNAPLPPGEDMTAAERAASLCTACDLSAKSLFVLPLTDHLLGYTIRLENAFYELAQGYYHTEARRVKSHKDMLNKTTHQFLFVRHQFKIAFFNELKQDSTTALKHYKMAYSHVLDLRLHDTNLLEVKTIAGFINYKICRLSFQHNAPLDAIAQFRKHIDFFKKKFASEELSFEHSAWMAKQFQVFGELFDEAIKLGLTAIQTQHPGLYFQQAANHAIARKHSAHKHSQMDVAYPTVDPLEHLEHLDYYGQRPWRQGHLSIEAPDLLKEKDGIIALQHRELQVDHSARIIPLLSSAVAQFKKYKSPRMKRYLMVNMGEEYMQAGDFNKALALFGRVLWDYRHEQWWPLLTNILTMALKCAYLVANVEQYVTFCLELMGKYLLTNHEEKTRIQTNLMRILSKQVPEPEVDCTEQTATQQRQWTSAIAHLNIFTIDMNSLFAFIECKTSFSEKSFTADDRVILKVTLLVSCPFPIRFTKLSVLLNNQVYNEHCVVDDQSSSDLYLTPGSTKEHSFTFLPQPADIGKTLEVTSVVLELGCAAILRWSGDHTAAARIEPRPSQLEVNIDHKPPCLVNERYVLDMNIVNKEDRPISNVKIAVAHKNNKDLEMVESTLLSLSDGDEALHSVSLGESSVASDESLHQLLYVCCSQPIDRHINLNVSYTVLKDDGAPVLCQHQQTIRLPVLSPFNVNVKLISMQLTPVANVHCNETFMVVMEMTCSSPWPLQIEDTEWNMSEYVREDGEAISSQLAGVKLKNNDCVSECRCVVTTPIVAPSVAIGTFSVLWKRRSDDGDAVRTEIVLPTVAVEQLPLSVSLQLPAHGRVRHSLLATYTIHNTTPYAQEIEVAMDASEAFMFAGHRQVHVRILPEDKYELEYNLVPLLPGMLSLPRLRLNMLRYPNTMQAIVSKMLQTHIYIMPSGKFNGNHLVEAA